MSKQPMPLHKPSCQMTTRKSPIRSSPLRVNQYARSHPFLSQISTNTTQLGGVTFQGKQTYVVNVLFAPPVQDIDTIEILVAGCTKILWYWNFLSIGTKQYEVKGFNLFTLNEKRQIKTVNLEFNSFAWALDTGYTIKFPPNPSPTKRA